jgi:pimeloyl-ACP methyl ester carboxylesterase
MHAAFEMYRAAPIAAKHNRESAKEKLRMPVLALGSERINRDAPLKSMQQLADIVQGGVVPQCGHFLAEECPEYLTQQLLTFFGKETGAQRSQAHHKK